MNGTKLSGIEGTNPLGFLAAIGVQVVFADELEQPKLWWSNDITPRAIVSEQFSIRRIAERAVRTFEYWNTSTALNVRGTVGKIDPSLDDLKLKPPEMRAYLSSDTDNDRGIELASALLAEGSLDKQGVAKPTDLYFTAGQQKFLKSARKILTAATLEEVVVGLVGPWKYESNSPSLGWDVTDDREYALRARDPSSDTKYTNPGVEALALLGLTRFPVFAGKETTLTQGCSGSWKKGKFSWPIWDQPATAHGVKSLLGNAYEHPQHTERSPLYNGWGIAKILKSPIRRSEQGGYGTFGPPEVVWERRQPSFSRLG